MPFLGKFPTQIVDPEVDIDGGAIDGVTIGATTASAATVTTLTSGNITTTGYIAGPSTFTIDPAAVGDNTGTLVVAGNLQVDGTTTTINSTTMTVDDLNITLASGAANAAAANGAGITVDGASATLTYNGTNDDWNFNKNLNTGKITATVDSNIAAAFSSTTTTAKITLADANDQAFIDINASRLGIGHASSTSLQALQIEPTSGEAMRIDSGGNVGIGETNPEATLHVGGEIISGAAASTTGQVILKSEYLSSSNDFVNILGTQRSNSSWVIGYAVKPSPTTSGVFLSTADNSNFKRGALLIDDELVFMNAGAQTTAVDSAVTLTERMRIDAAGRVGIGRNPTDVGLEVYGPAYTGFDGPASIFIYGDANYNDAGNAGSGILFGGEYTSAAALTTFALISGIKENTNNTDYAGALTFQTRPAGSTPVERMRIDSGGNVGIGVVPTDVGAYKTLEIGAKSGSKRGRIQFNTDQGNVTLYSFESGSQPYLGVYTDHASGTYIARFDSDGLKFGSDSAAANALDDYEEGTWTPAITGTAGIPSITYSHRSGYYIKTGNSVIARWGMRIGSISGGGGTLRITGLPYTAKNYGPYQQAACFSNTQGLTTDADGPVLFYAEDSQTTMQARIMNNSDTPLPLSYCQAGSWCIGTMIYDVT